MSLPKNVTPGPWDVLAYGTDDGRQITTKEEFLAFIERTWDKTPNEMRTVPLWVGSEEGKHCVFLLGCGPSTMANAYMGASSPDMYEALEQLLQDVGLSIALQKQGHVSPFNFDDSIGKAVAALSKARGETPVNKEDQA